MRRWQQSHRPPRALLKAQLDNILLIPASALPDKARYQSIANRLPPGEVLLVVSHAKHQAQHLLEATTASFEAQGHHVTTLGVDDLVSQRPTPR